MKYIFKISLLFLLMIILIWSCKKDEIKDYLSGGTAPILNSSLSADTLNLDPVDSANTLMVLNWTNPNYQFTTGISSQNVGYYLEIDTTGANFSSPHVQTIAFAGSLTTSFTVGKFNDLLGNGLLLTLGAAHNISIRVVSYLGNNNAELSSNVLNLTVTPYAPPPKVTPPSSGTLFIVGSAVGNWDNPIDAGNLSAQQFTQISSTDYQITIPIIGNGEYKFIGVDGSWNDQWSIKTEQVSGDPSTLNYDLFYNGGNGRAPIESATYLIDVNFQTGKVSFTKQ